MAPPVIRATRIACDSHGDIHRTRVSLDAPPVAQISLVESIIYSWWYRADPYPPGRRFGSTA